jgi:hypothetical protein
MPIRRPSAARRPSVVKRKMLGDRRRRGPARKTGTEAAATRIGRMRKSLNLKQCTWNERRAGDPRTSRDAGHWAASPSEHKPDCRREWIGGTRRWISVAELDSGEPEATRGDEVAVAVAVAGAEGKNARRASAGKGGPYCKKLRSQVTYTPNRDAN